MRLLVSGAVPAVERWAQTEYRPYLGVLVVPNNRNKIERLVATGLPIAADNGCFGGLNRPAFLRMLRNLRGAPVEWVAVPDVVGDAPATLARFHLWKGAIAYYGYPLAFVAQDGQEFLETPWEDVRTLFIGGSTEWKLGPGARHLVTEAKARGKLVHIGRVNSARRERLFAPLGADSFDGSRYSMFPDTYIGPALQRLARYEKEYPA